MLQNFRTLIFSGLTLSISLCGDASIDKHIRDGSGVDLTNGSAVTGMPYGYFVGQFGKSSIKGYDQQNLDEYQDKKLLIGYGVYDIKNENCRYLDVPSNSTFKVAFDFIFTLNNVTYGVSRDKLTYSGCLAKAAQYSGYVFTPKDFSEFSTAMRHFGNEKDMWMGYSRADCDTPYMNNENFEQNYENFEFPVETCDSTKLMSYKGANSYQWTRAQATETHYCPIKINSPDYLRPIRFCMPWWRVERQYKLNANEDVFEFNNERYDMKYAQYIMDYPKDEIICSVLKPQTNIFGTFKSSIRAKDSLGVFNDTEVVCTPVGSTAVSVNDFSSSFAASCSIPTQSTLYTYFTNSISCINTDTNDGVSSASCKQHKSNYEQTCNSYDSITASPVCIDDISQDVCHIDECAGYIKNVCTKKDTYTPFKDYDVGYILVDGIETRVKTKENKQVHTYNCPPPAPSDSECLQKDSVIVFPAHCPGSKCDELSACLKEKTQTADSCMAAHPCEKSYGSTDNIVRDADGVAVALRGICSDGSSVDATIEIKDTVKRTCNSYDEYNQTTQQYRNCTSNSESTNKIISTSITANDEYSLDERCIRTNNIEEARPSVTTVFDYTTKGYFKTAIQKAYIDKTDNNFETNASTEYVLASANFKIEPINLTTPAETPSTPPAYTQDEQFCLNTFSDAFMRRFSTDSDSEPYPALMGILDLKSPTSLEKCRSTATLKNNRCEYIYSACGSYNYDAVGDVCKDNNGNIKPFNCADYSQRDKNICYEDKWYSYPIIAVSSDKGTCDSYKTSLGFDKNTQGNVFYSDYDFAGLGITQAQIDAKNYCIIGGNPVTGDEQFSLIKKSLDSVYYTTASSITQSECEKIANCFSGNITTNYSSISSQKCTILANDNTDIDNGSFVPPENNPLTVPLVASSGTFTGEINGYSDVFSIQEYTDGSFGYISNYAFRLPQNNIVMLDGREVSPIIEQSPINYQFRYDFSQAQHNQTTKNRSPDNHSSGASGFFPVMHTYVGDNRVLGSTFFSNITEFVMSPIMIFGSKQYWGWYDSFYNLYQPLDANSKYFPNVYGYDPRYSDATTSTLILSQENIHSGTMKSSNYSAFRSSDIQAKKDLFSIMGFSDDTIDSLMISSNEKNAIGWPGVKWYKTSAKYTNQSSTSGTTYPIKPINTIFMGAVNSLSIVVPYKGEYELKAYDANDNLLATKIVQEQNFNSNVPSTTGNISQTFAKVQFATADDFNIAPGQDTSMSNNSCLSSNFVEWGGGVSGAYYEKGVPDLGLGSDCFKSNDYYVKSHSATKISLRATNSDTVFVIKLKKPLPFPNRVVLVNLMNLENRKFQCWGQLEQCFVNNSGLGE